MSKERICIDKEEYEKLIKDRKRLNFIEEYWFYCDGNSVEFCFNEFWFIDGYSLRDAIDADMKKTREENDD